MLVRTGTHANCMFLWFASGFFGFSLSAHFKDHFPNKDSFDFGTMSVEASGCLRKVSNFHLVLHIDTNTRAQNALRAFLEKEIDRWILHLSGMKWKVNKAPLVFGSYTGVLFPYSLVVFVVFCSFVILECGFGPVVTSRSDFILSAGDLQSHTSECAVFRLTSSQKSQLIFTKPVSCHTVVSRLFLRATSSLSLIEQVYLSKTSRSQSFS